ncbi:TetR/AcrR family transcriptional regulator [Streptomyces sp. TS71-3]|uniref:TetR/AcrR family transcriptional regulator n=1 Tax=Streptomyces sp. TS71-3 TaxID=2733862 RepID=UPI001B09F6BE|nr:TetR/AcrR family transcriptional regulator [Streptomyces sp. TS71-3]GHJ40954.1 TetR family transcriptional regulator [Streptomyces sp. TS71-3]
MTSSSTPRTTPKGAERRRRIVEEATRVFARNGYRAGSLATVAAAAGLTQQGLLHYFPTKEDLLVAVLQHRDERTEEQLGTQGSDVTPDSFVQTLRHNAREPEFPRLFAVLAAESTSVEHPTHEWFVDRYENLVTQLAAALEEEQAAGAPSAQVDPRTAARVLVALADGLRLQRLLSEEDFDHAEIVGLVLSWLRTGHVLADDGGVPAGGEGGQGGLRRTAP